MSTSKVVFSGVQRAGEKLDEHATGSRQLRRIVLVDPSPISRECLTFTLKSRVADLEIEGVEKSADAAGQNPDIVLLNIKGATVINDEVLRELGAIRRRYERVRIIVLSDLIDASAAFAAIGHGANGYFPTSLSLDILVAAFGLVLAGGTFIPTELIVPHALPPQADRRAAATELQMPKDRSFTSRELQVVTRLKEGKPNKIIAHELEISISTVKVHIRNIMKKLHATNRTQVVLLTVAGTQLPAA